MLSPRNMATGELAAWIATHLRSRGIDVVLSGGAVVEIYTGGRYVSLDMDFIEQSLGTRRKLREALAELGWTERNRYFVHPATAYFLEFPAGPLSVGDEPVAEISQLEFRTGTLHLLSPTDCVKDRLAAYYHWKDQQSLEQAVLVAGSSAVDLGAVERWSRKEKALPQFKVFLARVRCGRA
jgi:hypothetical protein